MSTSGVSEQEVQRFTDIFDDVFDEEMLEPLDDIDVLESVPDTEASREVSTSVVTEHEDSASTPSPTTISTPATISSPTSTPAEAVAEEPADEQSAEALLLDTPAEITWPALKQFIVDQVKLSLTSAPKLKVVSAAQWFGMALVASLRIWARSAIVALTRSRNVRSTPPSAEKASIEATEATTVEVTRRASGSQWLVVGAVAGAAIFGVNHGVLDSFTGGTAQSAQAAALRDPAALVSDTIAKANIWFQEKQSFTGFVADPGVQIAAGGPIIIITAGQGTYCSFAGIAPQYSTVVKLDPTGAHCEPVRVATLQAQLNDL